MAASPNLFMNFELLKKIFQNFFKLSHGLNIQVKGYLTELYSKNFIKSLKPIGRFQHMLKFYLCEGEGAAPHPTPRQ